MSHLEESLLLQMRVAKVPPPRREYRFAAQHVGLGPGVKQRLRDAGLKDWRIDFAWPEKQIAVEVEGGAWVGGRHTRGKGFEDDLDKYHQLTSMGWTVYRCGERLVRSGGAARLIAWLVNTKQAA